MAKTCIFCANAANSREHIFPDWVNGLFILEGKNGAWGELLQIGGESESHMAFPTSQVAGHKVKIVCDDCNGDTHGGWMSDLENEIAPLLKPAIRGEQMIFGPKEQLLIARWATKTAMVAETIMRYPPAFSQEDRKIVREEGRPPLRARPFIAAYQPTNKSPATRYCRSLGSVKSDGAGLMDLYIHTIQIGCLILQVRGTDTFPASENRALERVAVPGHFETQLFPPVEECRWPPRKVLNEEAFCHYSSAGSDPPPPPLPKRPNSSSGA